MSVLQLSKKFTPTHLQRDEASRYTSLLTTGGYIKHLKRGGPETAPGLLGAAADCCPKQVVAHIDFTKCCDTENDIHGDVADRAGYSGF